MNINERFFKIGTANCLFTDIVFFCNFAKKVMATITLEYDEQDVKARKAIDGLINDGLVMLYSHRKKKSNVNCYCGKAHIPNAKTLAAMKELDNGDGKQFESMDALFEDLYN
jgi:hypothetical protein